tara:strand:- start:351 stop:779 length:429 start_codon:yes stop_codon:yes gene_type:complete
MIEYFKNNEILYAIIINSEYKQEGINFFTPNEFSQQLGYMSRPMGYKIPPHYHNVISREVKLTNEVLFIKSGKIRVDFFDENQSYLESRVLKKGDIILLAKGGHGFEMLEKSEIIEVKQGPYAGDKDKTRFDDNVENKIINK